MFTFMLWIFLPGAGMMKATNQEGETYEGSSQAV